MKENVHSGERNQTAAVGACLFHARRKAVLFLLPLLLILLTGRTYAAPKLSAKVLTLRVGERYTLKVKGTKAKVTWSTNKKKVATVTKKGAVRAVKQGSAKITARVGRKKLICKVTVKPKVTVTVQKTNTGAASSSQTASSASATKTGTAASAGAAASTTGSAAAATTAKPASSVPEKTVTNNNTSTITSSGLSGETLRVFNVLIGFRSKYPEGKTFTNNDYYQWSGGLYRGGYGCAAFCFELSDAAFPGTRVKMYMPVSAFGSLKNLRPGDILRVDNNTHSVIVLNHAAGGDGVIVAEANYNKSVHWGRKVTYADILSSGSNIMTRYTNLYSTNVTYSASADRGGADQLPDLKDPKG